MMVFITMMDSFFPLWFACMFLLQVDHANSDVTVEYLNYTFGPYSDREGEFGYSYMGKFRGSLVLAKPKNGCSQMTKPSGGESWFVLIDAGGCSYYEKLINAKQSGFGIAIVRSMNSDELVTMKGSRIEMLGVYVGKTTGEVLAHHNYSTGAKVVVEVDFRFNPEIYLIPLVIIIGVCFILMALFLIVKYWRTRMQERRSRITPANLKKIPTLKYKEGDKYDLCAICLDDYKVGEKLRVLPCGHAYHCKCVDPWLTNGKKTCPVCKQPVEKDEAKKRDKKTTRPDEPTERTPLLSEDVPTTSHQALRDSTSTEVV